MFLPKIKMFERGNSDETMYNYNGGYYGNDLSVVFSFMEDHETGQLGLAISRTHNIYKDELLIDENEVDKLKAVTYVSDSIYGSYRTLTCLVTVDLLGAPCLEETALNIISCLFEKTASWLELQNLNLFVAEYLKRFNYPLYELSMNKLRSYLMNTNSGQATSLIKILKYVLYEPVMLEKLLKTLDFNTFAADLNSHNDILRDQGKLHHSVGVSKKTLSKIQELSMPEILDPIRAVSELNENYPLTIIDFIETYKEFTEKTKIITPNSYNQIDWTRFVTDITYLLNNKYELKAVLNYVLKQNFLYSTGGFNTSSKNWSASRFVKIHEVSSSMADYVKMATDMNVPYEKYPPILNKIHQIFVENYKSLSDGSVSKDFEEVVSKWDCYEVSNAKYQIVAPKEVKDIVFEGNYLHHCVSSYASHIAYDGSIVLFVRKNTQKETPFVTIEISKNKTLNIYQLVQAKGMFHEDPEKEIMKEINDLINKINGGIL